MDDYIVESYEHNGLRIEIRCDNFPDNPLEWDSPESRGVYFALRHSRYDLPWEIKADTDDYDGWRELARAVTGKGGQLEGYTYKFVNWYEHSGVIVRLQDNDTPSDRWDSGIAGVVFGKTAKEIESEFAVWKCYTEGDVYGYTIINPKNGEEWDSCWGYYGLDDVMAEANSMADSFVHPHEAAYAKNAVIKH